MTYPEFEARWVGKSVDYDGVYGKQCVDLIKQYLAECYGLSPGAWGNAIDYWTRTAGAILTKFDKISGSNAKRGDIVVMNGLTGNPYGHIGIATGAANGTSVEILEQNGSTGGGSGTGADAIRKRYISRSRVAGLLRPKELDEVIATTDEATKIYKMLRPNGSPSAAEVSSTAGRRTYKEFLYSAQPEIANRDTALRNQAASVAGLQGTINSLNQTVNDTKAQLAAKDHAINAAKAEAAELGKAVILKDNEIKKLQAELAVQSSDTQLLNGFGEWLKKLIIRLGLSK